MAERFVTEQELESAVAYVTHLVTRFGEVLTPILDRLKYELEVRRTARVLDERSTKATARVSTLEAIAFKPADAGAMIGVRRSTIYNLINKGKLKAKKVGNSTVVPYLELKRLIDEAPYCEAIQRAMAARAQCERLRPKHDRSLRSD